MKVGRSKWGYLSALESVGRSQSPQSSGGSRLDDQGLTRRRRRSIEEAGGHALPRVDLVRTRGAQSKAALSEGGQEG
jgi:hypothetical protein